MTIHEELVAKLTSAGGRERGRPARRGGVARDHGFSPSTGGAVHVQDPPEVNFAMRWKSRATRETRILRAFRERAQLTSQRRPDLARRRPTTGHYAMRCQRLIAFSNAIRSCALNAMFSTGATPPDPSRTGRAAALNRRPFESSGAMNALID